MMMHRWGPAVIAGVALVLSGCASDPALSASSDAFAGLDPAVTEEVLAHPAAKQKIAEEPAETRESMAQGIVRNFIVCRAAHEAYQSWMTSGVSPTLAPLPEPRSPREPSHSDWITAYERLEAHVTSGEPEQLRSWLTGTGSCGEWIPAAPGDASGPTIKDAVEAVA